MQTIGALYVWKVETHFNSIVLTLFFVLVALEFPVYSNNTLKSLSPVEIFYRRYDYG